MRQAARRGDTRSSRALRSLDHNNTSPLYENPVSLYPQFQHCSANHVGKEKITILLSTWLKWDRVGEIGPVHTVTKGESGGEPDYTTAYLSRLHESYEGANSYNGQ